MEGEKTLQTALTEKVRLKVAVIGCGNAGSQLVAAMYKADTQANDLFCVNTSRKDMDDQVIPPQIECFLAGTNGRGAGMDRDAGKTAFSANYEDLLNKQSFVNMCERNDIIIVGASTSGGSGSGIAPILTKALKMLYPGKIIIFYGILPRLNASVHELANCRTCVNEIVDIASSDAHGLPYMLVDLNHFTGVPNETAYPAVIKKMVRDIQTIRGDFLNYSPLRMIDENDTRVIISPSGLMTIYMVEGITQQTLDKTSTNQLLLKEIKNSPAVPIARDGIVDQMAFISNMPRDMEDAAKAGDYSEILAHVGQPLSIFENYAIIQGGVGQIIMIASGQSYPVGHMTQIDSILVKAEEDRKAKLEGRKTYDVGMTGTYEFLQGGSAGADLLDTKQSLSGDERKKALKGLFDK